MNSSCFCQEEYRINQEEGYLICPKCGTIGNEIFINQKKYDETYTFPIRGKYKRKHYFRQKIKELTDINIKHIDNYDEIYDYLKTFDDEVKTIEELKEILKLSKLRKWYKYIYALFYHLKGERLFKFTVDEIDEIEKRFLEFENTYQREFNSRNITGYNIFLYCVLREMGYECHKHILLPNKVSKII